MDGQLLLYKASDCGRRVILVSSVSLTADDASTTALSASGLGCAALQRRPCTHGQSHSGSMYVWHGKHSCCYVGNNKVKVSHAGM